MNVRIIPRLEIKGANVVKGMRFDGLRVLGSPRDFARLYYEEGADELIYIDVVASLYERRIRPEVVRETAQDIFIPLTVGGGVRTLGDIEELLNAGADKVAINTAALQRAAFLSEAARTFGSQCIVLSIEAKRSRDGYEPYAESGRQPTGLDVITWAKRAVDLGVGELLVTSIDNEGTAVGFDLPLCKLFERFPIPVIIAGGAGSREHVAQLLEACQPDGVACASLFHYHALPQLLSESMNTRERVEFDRAHEQNYAMPLAGAALQTSSLSELKEFLTTRNVPVRRAE